MAKYPAKYPVAVVRERLAEALDRAQRGEDVLIERRGVTYRLSVESASATRHRKAPSIEILDPAVEAGDWTWQWDGRALTFRGRQE